MPLSRIARPLGLLLLFVPVLALAGPSAEQLAAGQAAFATCTRCHRVGPEARSGYGPQLNGIVGRRAGTLPDFNYSAAMKRSGIVWDARSLAAFIRNPDQVVPGNRMRFASWGYDDRKIADLVAYLASFPAER
ncbi:MAG: cytochrome c family protein [Roseateles depolymerans]|uniref:Cytochrome c family protein n=1 Tax=Roseateles depolymerans TaxID=76731 RepID=A0A2W5DP61_9BURK|nr:MAG: cytochrome c family protein [Roseateles depolymerans]